MCETRGCTGQGSSVQFKVARRTQAERVHRLPCGFDPQTRPWIQPGADTADDVGAVLARFTTGALQLRSDGGIAAETVSGRSELIMVTRETRMALCRSEASAPAKLGHG